MGKIKNYGLAALALGCLLLAGCGSSVRFEGGSFPESSTEISLVLQEGESALLDRFSALERADLSGSQCYEEIFAWAQAHPEVDTRYTVAFPGGETAENTDKSLELSELSSQSGELNELLGWLPALERVELSGALEPEELQALTRALPEIRFSYEFSLLGQSLDLSDTALSFEGLGRSDSKALLDWLPAMSGLSAVDLGDDSAGGLSWEDIAALQAACPQVEFQYAFSLYGRSFSLTDQEMDLNHLSIEDEGELVKQVTACMPELRYLDMDSCGVSDESMAEIRDSLPRAEVVWRIWFGDCYSVRTDVERILASNPGRGGELTVENTRSLKYCTKVKYLDLGHNNYMFDISFVSYMPELEAAVLAMGGWTDASPLADCPKLNYLEIQSSGLNDVSALAGLKNLRHLNIAYCFALHDISPLYELTELERLWIGCLDPIPQEQIEEMQRRAPNCVINTSVVDPTADTWRYLEITPYGVAILDPRYELLRQQFRYGDSPNSYAYYWNDPLYYPHD